MWAWALRLVPLLGKGSPVIMAGLVGVLCGVWVTHEYYEKQEHDKALALAIERAEQGKKDYAKIIKISDELNESMATSGNLRLELERVRKLYATARKATATQGVDRATVERCERLLSESTGLLTEGGELLQRNALKHDAVIKALK